jgi:hypothetical protein
MFKSVSAACSFDTFEGISLNQANRTAYPSSWDKQYLFSDMISCICFSVRASFAVGAAKCQPPVYNNTWLILDKAECKPHHLEGTAKPPRTPRLDGDLPKDK